jgi:hypothetical protein
MTAEERWALTKFPADVYQYQVDLFLVICRVDPIRRSLPYPLFTSQPVVVRYLSVPEEEGV